jgi:hypothetical protein
MNWASVIRDNRLLVNVIRMCQRTMRGRGVIPTWFNFTTTEYYHKLAADTDASMRRKFRAWWNLIFHCGDIDRQKDKRRFVYAWFLVVNHSLMTNGKAFADPSAKMGLTESNAALIRDHVLTNYSDLALK